MEQLLYQLPEGWEWYQLADVVEKTENLNLLKDAGQLWTYIDIASVDRNRFKIKEPKKVLGKDAPSRAKKHIQLNDVIFATTRPNLKNIALVREEYRAPVASTGFCVLRANERVLPAYLFYFVTTDFVQRQIEPYVGGASYPAITDRNLKKAQIPVPNISEQKRTVQKLDRLLNRIDTAIEYLQESVILADALYASTLDALSKAVKGKKMKLGELGKVIRGSSPRPKGDPRYYGGNVPRLMVGDVTRDGRFVTPAIDFLTDEGALKSRPVPKGTLTIQVSGNPGMPAILAVDACIHDGFAALIEIDQKRISTEYLYFSLLAVAEQNNQMAVGAIFRNLTTSQLREIKITIPSYGKQLEMVKWMDEAERKVNTLKSELKIQLDTIYRLKESVLDSAFKGEM